MRDSTLAQRGPDIPQNIDPVRPLLDAGVKVSLHSDSPVSPSFPLLFVHFAATRLYQVPPGGTPAALGPQHRVSTLEALKCVTLYPDEAAYSEHEIGSLQPGKLADIVVLEQDPTAIDLGADPDGISRIRVLQANWCQGPIPNNVIIEMRLSVASRLS